MNTIKYKKKIKMLSTLLTIVLTAILIGSVVPSTVGAANTAEYQESFSFSVPEFTGENKEIQISIEGASIHPGLPKAPLLVSKRGSIALPEGATDVQIEFIPGEISSLELPEGKQLLPSPVPVSLTMPSSTLNPDIATYEYIYNSHERFGQFFSSSLGYGIVPEGYRTRIVSYSITPCIFTDVANGQMQYITEGELRIHYEIEQPELSDLEENYDLLIISANDYVDELSTLVLHKESMGFSTKLVSINDISNEEYIEHSEVYNRDLQEQIKYFIYQAIDEWDIEYVLAVGGYRTFFGLNVPDKQFPIRYSHLDDGAEPGYACDQYYSCCIDAQATQTKFDSWDSNNDGIFAWYNEQNPAKNDYYDFYPDIYFGRLACRNKIEVRTMVDKIITYERHTSEEDWFNKMLTITGDGFQDQNDLGIDWNINQNPETQDPYPDGDYTIYAQSSIFDDDSVKGNIDQVKVTVDRSAPSKISFEETDHLKIEPLTEEQETLYPGKPVAEIVVPSDHDVLGNTKVQYTPEEAYIGDRWASVNYNNGILTIRSKSYDPSPKDNVNSFASRTKLKVWINNSEGEIVYGPVERESVMYYEGEMECQLAIDYMSGVNAEKLWTSNGKWTKMWDVIHGISQGHGFVYFAGHGNPMSWGDHLPGIPGGRDDGMINGLKNVNLDFGLARYEGEEGDPFFPMDNLYNGDKQAVTLIGGCHNSFIDASFMKLFYDPEEVLFTVLHGGWIPESFSWWLTRMPQGGAIATIGCAGLGYGYLGQYCVYGLGGWINPEFFNQYAIEGHDVLGVTFTETLRSYLTNSFDWENGYASPRKTFEEWVLLGDPTLKIGGYSFDASTETLASGQDMKIVKMEVDSQSPNRIFARLRNVGPENFSYFNWSITVEGDAPLARYFGVSGSIFEVFFRGRVQQGQYTTEYVTNLEAGKKLDIYSQPVFGFGHIKVTIGIHQENDLVRSQSEDGFLIGSRILLHHGEE